MKPTIALLIAVGGFTSIVAADRPNILLIVADDLGFSDLGCFGGEIATPHLDGLAAHGVRLAQFYNTGRCCPSRASLMTGQYPHRVGLGHMTQDLGHAGYRGRLSTQSATIPEVLGMAGYRAFMSGKWHLGTDDPTQRGFEEFFGTLQSARTFWDASRYLRLPSDRQRRGYGEGEFYGTDALTDYALDFLTLARRTPERPWFLYLAYNAPHFPLQAPGETIENYKGIYHKGWDAIRVERLKRLKQLGLVSPAIKLPPRSRWWNYGETESDQNPAWSTLPQDRQLDLARRMAIYAAMVHRMDENIGRIIRQLRHDGQLADTLIVFLSDNGACAEWDPRGFDGKSSNNVLHRGPHLDQMGGPGTYHSLGSGWANASNTPWRLYKHFCHEGGISTPCIMHWPNRLKRRGAIEAQPAHLIDLMPTFVEAAGAHYPDEIDGKTLPSLPGRSLLPMFEGTALATRPLYFEHEGHRAIREGPWKLSARKGQPWCLYDVGRDRTEMTDLTAQWPEQARRLAQKWDRWAASNDVTPFPQDYKVAYLKAAATTPSPAEKHEPPR